MTSQNKKKNLKRKQRQASFDDSIEDGNPKPDNNGLDDDSQRTIAEEENDSEASSRRPFWTAYCQVYDKLTESASNIQTAEECIVTSRIVDITSAKLAQEIQKLDLTSIDHWTTISLSLVQNWNKFFSVSENDGWSFSDLIPINRYKANCFGYRNILLKRKNNETNEVLTQKKKRTVRKDENRAKLSKPLQGKVDDKPLPLIDHMKRVVSAIESRCSNGQRSVEYFRLILDPNSFPSTVYNIFTISFLIREGLVAFSLGKKGEPLISLKSESSSQRSKENEQGKGHFIIDLTTSEWEVLVKKLGITTAMVSCPNATNEEDTFFQRFSQSQKEIGKKRKR